MTNYIRNNRMFLSICGISFLLLFTVRTLYTFSARDYHVKNNEKASRLITLPYSPLNRAIKVANYLTNLEIQKLQKEQARIDLKYCGGPCRFVNFLYIREQETRAQLHVRHLAFTAGLVNRTIVLPNVSGSHIGACLSHDFEYYYDIQWARRNQDYFKYITMKDFIAWIQERKQYNVPVSDQVLSAFDIDTTTTPTKVSHCFSDYTRPKSSLNQILTWNTTGQTRKASIKAREELMIDFLKGPLVDDNLNTNDDIEVLHMEIHKANQWSHISKANVPIPYNKELAKFADETAKSLGPYIAVHWRMEASYNTDYMVPCAEHLVSLLRNKKMRKFKIFLLTDYPHMFTLEQQNSAIKEQSSQDQLSVWLQSNSDSFLTKHFTTDHHKAIQYLYQHDTFHLLETTMNATLETPNNWRIMSIPPSLKLVDVHNQDKIKMIDSGWLGILDKLMAIRSVHFFAGRKGDICGRSRSTFTAQIIDERISMQKSKTNYFGRP